MSSSWRHRDQRLLTETRPSVRVRDLQHTGHRSQISPDGVRHHQRNTWNERKAHVTCGAREKVSLNTLNGWNQQCLIFIKHWVSSFCFTLVKHLCIHTWTENHPLRRFLKSSALSSHQFPFAKLILDDVWSTFTHYATISWTSESYPCDEIIFPSVSVSVYLMTFLCVNESLSPIYSLNDGFIKEYDKKWVYIWRIL